MAPELCNERHNTMGNAWICPMPLAHGENCAKGAMRADAPTPWSKLQGRIVELKEKHEREIENMNARLAALRQTKEHWVGQVRGLKEALEAANETCEINIRQRTALEKKVAAAPEVLEKTQSDSGSEETKPTGWPDPHGCESCGVGPDEPHKPECPELVEPFQTNKPELCGNTFDSDTEGSVPCTRPDGHEGRCADPGVYRAHCEKEIVRGMYCTRFDDHAGECIQEWPKPFRCSLCGGAAQHDSDRPASFDGLEPEEVNLRPCKCCQAKKGEPHADACDVFDGFMREKIVELRDGGRPAMADSLERLQDEARKIAELTGPSKELLKQGEKAAHDAGVHRGSIGDFVEFQYRWAWERWAAQAGLAESEHELCGKSFRGAENFICALPTGHEGSCPDQSPTPVHTDSAFTVDSAAVSVLCQRIDDLSAEKDALVRSAALVGFQLVASQDKAADFRQQRDYLSDRVKQLEVVVAEANEVITELHAKNETESES